MTASLQGPPVLRILVADDTPVGRVSLARGGAKPKARTPTDPAPPPLSRLVEPDIRIAARSSGRKVVFLSSSSVWAFEARDRLVFVHAPQGTFDIDVTLGEVQLSLGARVLRVHRNWLVSLSKVRELRSAQGAMHLFAGGGVSAESPERVQRPGVDVPVARERMKQVRQVLLADTFGVRPAIRRRRRAAVTAAP